MGIIFADDKPHETLYHPFRATSRNGFVFILLFFVPKERRNGNSTACDLKAGGRKARTSASEKCPTGTF
jgi:hypothetical protein